MKVHPILTAKVLLREEAIDLMNLVNGPLDVGRHLGMVSHPLDDALAQPHQKLFSLFPKEGAGRGGLAQITEMAQAMGPMRRALEDFPNHHADLTPLLWDIRLKACSEIY